MASGDAQIPSGDAMSQGRRIYLGNILFAVKRDEIEDALREHGFDDFEAVHMTVDTISSRNPGYCFVDFTSREGAERALDSLNATIRGRTLKVGPCKLKQGRAVNRWNSDSRTTNQDAGDESIRRVFVGGLGEAVDDAHNTEEMTDLLAGFTPTKISKRFAPRDSKMSQSGNLYYCFLDFETPEEAQAVIEALDGKTTQSGPLRASLARPSQSKTRERSNYNDNFGGRTRRNHSDHDGAQAESSPRGARSMASDNWRRKND